MENNQLLKTLEEEVLRIQNQVNFNKRLLIDNNMLEKVKDEIRTFNTSFFYGPAEKAIQYNLAGISYALDGNFFSAIENFKLALQHFEHITIATNLAKCYEKQSQYRLLDELNEQYQIEKSEEYSFDKGTYLNPEYLDIDRKNEDIDYSHLQGYEFVYEKKATVKIDSNKTCLVFNVPYVIWSEFYTVFIELLKNQDYKYSLIQLKDKGELFLMEVNQKPYIHEQFDADYIPFYLIAEVEILNEDKDTILNLYKHFIVNYYLKFYNPAYKYEEMINMDPGLDDYLQQNGELERVYGKLKSAIYGLKVKQEDPILTLNLEEYYKGIYEFRSFFPHIFSNEAIALGLLESTFEKKLIEKIKNSSLKKTLLKEFEESLLAIKSHPSTIYLHTRRSMEIVFQYISKNSDVNIQVDAKYVTLNDYIKEVIKLMKKKNYLYKPILDVMNSKQVEYISRQKFEKSVYLIKNDSNKSIHFNINEDFSDEIDSERALSLFLKNIAIISILIDEFDL